MTDRTGRADEYLEKLGQRIGSRTLVLASDDGLLVAGAGADLQGLEELAAYAPSGIPKRVTLPAGMSRARLEVDGMRFYLASLDAVTPPEATTDLEKILERG